MIYYSNQIVYNADLIQRSRELVIIVYYISRSFKLQIHMSIKECVNIWQEK